MRLIKSLKGDGNMRACSLRRKHSLRHAICHKLIKVDSKIRFTNVCTTET